MVNFAGEKDNDDMAQYDENDDPREAGQKVPLVTGEAPWLTQVSFKTPSGTLINIRGMEAIDVMAGLAALRGMADEIQGIEALFSNPLQALGATPIRQYQQTPQAPQQGGWQPQPQAPQGPSGPTPMCKHGLPAKYVQGGIAKSTGRPYKAFWACSLDRSQQCDFRQDG